MNLPSLLASQSIGLNFNLFETNILNLALVVFGLYKFLPNFLGGILSRRRESILADLQEAEKRLEEANSSLDIAKKDLSSAEQKALQIRSDCLKRAESIRSESEKKTVFEMARIKEEANSDLNAEAARLSSQLRRETAQLAIKKALSVLPSKLNDQTQEEFLSRSINNMEKA
tara:strand:- start:868 stop:1383 length:516 start_codon:yes stop_codon:yes gene_type:complete